MRIWKKINSTFLTAPPHPCHHKPPCEGFLCSCLFILLSRATAMLSRQGHNPPGPCVVTFGTRAAVFRKFHLSYSTQTSSGQLSTQNSEGAWVAGVSLSWSSGVGPGRKPGVCFIRNERAWKGRGDSSVEPHGGEDLLSGEGSRLRGTEGHILIHIYSI